jgi:hypothetical protein
LKKTLLIILTRFGSLINWKWLTLWAGALLLCFMQSCKTKDLENSTGIVPNDTSNVDINTCYDTTVFPPNEEIHNSIIMEIK